MGFLFAVAPLVIYLGLGKLAGSKPVLSVGLGFACFAFFEVLPNLVAPAGNAFGLVRLVVVAMGLSFALKLARDLEKYPRWET